MFEIWKLFGIYPQRKGSNDYYHLHPEFVEEVDFKDKETDREEEEKEEDENSNNMSTATDSYNNERAAAH